MYCANRPSPPAPCLSFSSWEVGGRRPLTFSELSLQLLSSAHQTNTFVEHYSGVGSVVVSGASVCSAGLHVLIVLISIKSLSTGRERRRLTCHCVYFYWPLSWCSCAPRLYVWCYTIRLWWSCPDVFTYWAMTIHPQKLSPPSTVWGFHNRPVADSQSHHHHHHVRPPYAWRRVHTLSTRVDVHCVCAETPLRHISTRWGLLLLHRGPAGSHRSAALSWSPNSLHHSSHSLFTLTQSWWWEPGPPSPPPPPPHPPPHYLLYLMGPLLFPPPLSLSTFIYIFIYFTPALRVTVFNIIGETWLLPLNAEITGAFFLSSSPLHFSRVAPRGRNIFISPCAPSFKTFTPAVWKIFLIFLPHGVEKSP